jgi:hypothetical protein
MRSAGDWRNRLVILGTVSFFLASVVVLTYAGYSRWEIRKGVASSGLVVAKRLAEKANDVVIRERDNMPAGDLPERDRWGKQLRARYVIKVSSPGPDGRFDTNDDVEVEYPLVIPKPIPEEVPLSVPGPRV